MNTVILFCIGEVAIVAFGIGWLVVASIRDRRNAELDEIKRNVNAIRRNINVCTTNIAIVIVNIVLIIAMRAIECFLK